MFSSILLQAGGQSTGAISQFLLIGGIMLVFYFFMLRPQQKKQKQQQKFRDELKKGDSVVTIGGLHGRVFSIEGNQVTLEVDKGIKLTFEKTAISQEFSTKTTTTTPEK